MTIKDFEREQGCLLKKVEIKEAWLEFRSRFPHINLWFRNSPQFKNQLAWVEGRKASSDLNLYKLFTEQSLHLLRKGGCGGIVIPSGIYTDLGAKQLREMLFSETKILGLFCLENRKEIFEGVHRSFKFVVLTFEKGSETTEFPTAFMRLDVEELSRFPHEGAISQTVSLVRKVSPESLSLTEIRSQADISIIEKCYTFPTLGKPVGGRWQLVLQREFHMTDDAALYRQSRTKGCVPLYEGKMIWQFDHKFTDARYWVNETEARSILLSGRLKTLRELSEQHGMRVTIKPDQLLLDYQSYRFCFRDVAASTNERTIISTILPAHVCCPHTMTLEVVYHDEIVNGEVRINERRMADGERLYLVAVLNSFVADYQLRQKVTNHLSYYFIYNLPVPRLTEKDPAFAPIVSRAAKLICTTPEFDDLAREFGLGSHAEGVTDPAARATCARSSTASSRISTASPKTSLPTSSPPSRSSPSR